MGKRFVLLLLVSAACSSSNSNPADGGTDAGNFDAGIGDAGNFDAGIGDAGNFDAGIGDAGNFDAGIGDAGASDAGIGDAGNSDAGSSDAGTGDGGMASISGTVSGTTLMPVSAASTVSTTGAAANMAIIAISETASLCSDEQASITHRNARALGLQLQNQDASGNQTIPIAGTYDITASPQAGAMSASAIVLLLDNQCMTMPNSPVASMGSVTLTNVNLFAGGETDGTFDLTFGTDHLTGSFAAPFCDQSAAPTTLTCQ
jgi:hypothetical protein